LKFKAIADLRGKGDNQLLITPTKTKWDELGSNAGSPKYAIPYDASIILEINGLQVIDNY